MKHLSSKQKKTMWPAIILVLIAYAYFRPCMYIAMPPLGSEWGVFREGTSPLLKYQIKNRMAEINRNYPVKAVNKRMRVLERIWEDKLYRVELEKQGLAALPFIEARARSRDTKTRMNALGMLLYLSPTGTREGHSPSNVEMDVKLRKRYMWPIWRRALNDVEPEARRWALRRWYEDNYLRAVTTLSKLMCDNDQKVRVEAARLTIGIYHRSDLVPIRVRLEMNNTEVQ